MEATGPPGHLFLDHLPPVGLTGTKYACGRGGCGACTVMVSKCEPVSKKIRYPAQKPRARGGFYFFARLVYSHLTAKEDLQGPPSLVISLSLDLRPFQKSDNSCELSSQKMH